MQEDVAHLLQDLADHPRDGDHDGDGKNKTLTEGHAWASLTEFIGRARAIIGQPQRHAEGVRIDLPLEFYTEGGEQHDESTGAPEPAEGGLVDHGPEDGASDGQRD